MADNSVTFPFLISRSGRYLTIKGDFYYKVGSGKDEHWRKCELYLPASPKIYNMSSLEEVAHSRFEKLENGDIKIKPGLTDGGYIDSKKYYFTKTK